MKQRRNSKNQNMMFGESKSRVLSFLEYVIVCEIVFFFLGGG